jgi:hypothetical protein
MEQHLGAADGFYGFVSNHNAKFYASFVPVNCGEALGVAIMGPYETGREADKMLDKWKRLNRQRIARKQPTQFLDMTTVPDDARTYITHWLTAAVGSGDLRIGDPFGRAFH